MRKILIFLCLSPILWLGSIAVADPILWLGSIAVADPEAKTPAAATEKSVPAATEKAAPATQPATTPTMPETVDEAVGTVKDAVSAAKGGSWWYFSSLAVMLLVGLLKYLGTVMGWWSKLGRWRYVIVPVLGLVAALLAAFQGGVSIEVAVGVFTSSYATSALQQLWKRGILGGG